MEMKSIQQMIESVSDKLDKLIAEHGGSARDALNVTLAKLEWAEWEIAQLKSAQQSFAPDTACAECQQPYPNHSHTCSLAGS